jgi:hypothetical protein
MFPPPWWQKVATVLVQVFTGRVVGSALVRFDFRF